MYKPAAKWGLLLLSGVLAAWSLSSVSREGGYLDILPVFWSELYPDGGITLYCRESFRPFDRSVNVEHVFPMGWVSRELRCGKRDQCRRTSSSFNRIESDMHNLYPARKDVNRSRAAYPFAMIKGERHPFPGCDLELDHQSRRVEPSPEIRGDIARAMLYMADEYGLQLHKKQRRLMIEWHEADPPGREERRRNEIIERIQGKRNRYIDSGFISR